MNKSVITISVAFTSMLVLSASVLADGYIFEPATSGGYSYVETAPAAASAKPAATYKSNVTPSVSAVNVQATSDKENSNCQNAILELDNAQVEIRTRLLDLKSQYSDIDEKYRLIKEQRAALKKLVKQTEKRITNIEKAKSNIKKEML